MKHKERMKRGARISALLLSAMMIASAATAFADTISSDTTASGGSYSSTAASENALKVSGATVSLSGITVSKSGDSSGGDNDNFYGTNSAVLAADGAKLTITGSSISSNANGANGVFSYGGNGGTNGAAGDGTTVTISDSSITTTGNNAGGIMTTGGGVMNASNLTISTSGNSSAAIRTDRGGGTVTVNGGTYTAEGTGSPAIYSTADISVTGAALTTTKSEAVVIEGKNSVTLNSCTVSGNNSQKNGQSTTYENVKIYQSMSGDAASGTAVFTMNGGSMTCAKGSMFHVTNTSAVINLKGASLTNSSDDVLLAAGADSWGSSGSNGGNATLNAEAQTLSGTITVDSISTLNLIMSDSSSFIGKINTSGQEGSVYVEIPEGCTWTLTGDSYISSLTCAAASIDLNGHALYVNGTAYEAGTASQGSKVEGNSGSGSNGESQNGTPGQPPQDGENGQPPQDQNGQQPPQNGENGQPPQDQNGQQPPQNGENGQPPQDGQQPPQNGENGQQSPQDGQNGTTAQTPENDQKQPTVSVKATVIKKLVRAKKAFTVKWKKVSGADGYQIQYSTSKKFTGSKTVTVKKGLLSSKKIKKLKSGKTYYVRIRTYKTVNGSRQYSSWSAVKHVRTR